ncbi:MAG: hypothetical protein Q9187_007025, partial [Circinaria calcarea]
MRLFASPSSGRSPLSSWGEVAVVLLASSTCAAGIELDPDNPESVKAAASKVAYGMMKYYKGNETGQTPGLFPDPYFWWEAGAAFGAMLDYYYYTGDPTYNEVTMEALLAQVGPNNDYMPPNQTKTEGNDDQGFWALAAMTAAEQKFPNPPDNQPQWLALAQAVFNSQALRWDTTTCAGGLKWQIFAFNNGYNYKNSISNGCFFNMGARLAVYTGNQTYADWAERTWDWVNAVGLMSPRYQVFDGTDDNKNCSELNHIQWTYNAGVYLLGAANMYAYRVESLLNATAVFFHPTSPNVMYEVACEPQGNCNLDQASFKAYLSRWMAATTKLAPFTTDFIMTKLRASAIAAAKQCTGGADGTTCGIRWTTNGVWDGSSGVGQQMSALEVIQSNLISSVAAPVTNSTGGISVGNPSAGTGAVSPIGLPTNPIMLRDQVGAGFLTAFALLLV